MKGAVGNSLDELWKEIELLLDGVKVKMRGIDGSEID
jgi:hypothetical protein